MVDRAEIQWKLSVSTVKAIADLRESLGEVEYAETKRAFQELLAGYFSAELGCKSKLGKTISPLGGTAKGGRSLKVRWALPGGGRSGGLRLLVIAYCDEQAVLVAGAFPRIDDPSDEEFGEATTTAESEA